MLLFPWRKYGFYNYLMPQNYRLVSSLLGEALGLAAGDNTKDDDEMSDLEGLGSQEEEKQLQNMMYNLMVSWNEYKECFNKEEKNQ